MVRCYILPLARAWEEEVVGGVSKGLSGFGDCIGEGRRIAPEIGEMAAVVSKRRGSSQRPLSQIRRAGRVQIDATLERGVLGD
jgi:hypothetical protein